MQIMTFPRLVYVPERGAYLPEDEAPAGARVMSISGTELRQRLTEGRDLPAWFTPPEIAAELRRSFPSGKGRKAAAVRELTGRAASCPTGGLDPAI